MKDAIETMIRESQRPVRASEVVVRFSNGEHWTFTEKSEVRTPEGERVSLEQLPRLLASRSVPYITFRGRWRVEEEDKDMWKEPSDGPLGGVCEVSFFVDQIVRISKLYRD